MQQLKGRTAVITGAGSGFGRELALLCAGEGMNVVLADVDEKAVQQTAALLPASTQALRVRCDVSKAGEVENLAEETYRRFGAAHLLFNNAGVACAGPVWTATLQDWEWVLGVNLMGVVHGVRSFVPRMLASGHACHVVNTASVAGLLSVPASGVYCVSKHGVVTLSECLHHELTAAKAPIGVSVLCPAFVKTGIADSERNRPKELAHSNPLGEEYAARIKKAIEHGRLSARDIAVATMEAVKENRFYIITHGAIKPAIDARMRDILEGRPPTNPMP